MKLTTAQLDRACGVLLATAAGDALGAPYEFGPLLAATTDVVMSGGGGWETGEWTDDTSMAIAIAEVAATGAALGQPEAQDRIVGRGAGWAHGAREVGIRTRSVLSAGGTAGADAARRAAAGLHQRSGRSGGN